MHILKLKYSCYVFPVGLFHFDVELRGITWSLCLARASFNNGNRKHDEQQEADSNWVGHIYNRQFVTNKKRFEFVTLIFQILFVINFMSQNLFQNWLIVLLSNYHVI